MEIHLYYSSLEAAFLYYKCFFFVNFNRFYFVYKNEHSRLIVIADVDVEYKDNYQHN